MNELTTQTIDPMLQMIERVALDPNADVSKLEKLIELSERVSDRQAKADFDKAMLGFQIEKGVIEKIFLNSKKELEKRILFEIKQYQYQLYF